MSGMSVFRFRIDDPDADIILFGCVAASEAEAALTARAAGFRDFDLFDRVPLGPGETVEAATERIRSNPLLGPDWLRIVDVIAVVTRRLRPGAFWRMDTYAAAFGFDPYASPFVQAMMEADGALHVEIGGVPIADLEPLRAPMLDLLGWNDLSSSDVTDARELRRLPLPHRVFEPGWNAASVAEAVLQTLVLGYGLTEADFFSFGEQAEPPYLDVPGIQVVEDGPIFRLSV